MAEPSWLGLHRSRRRLLRGRLLLGSLGRGGIEGARRLLLLLLLKLLLKLLRDSRHRRRRAGLERLLLRSSLAGEAGELGLKLAGSLRLRLLQARVSGVLLLKRSLGLAVAGGLGSERTRLLPRLPKGVSILLLRLRPRAETVASAEEGVGLGVHVVAVSQGRTGGLTDDAVARNVAGGGSRLKDDRERAPRETGEALKVTSNNAR